MNNIEHRPLTESEFNNEKAARARKQRNNTIYYLCVAAGAVALNVFGFRSIHPTVLIVLTVTLLIIGSGIAIAFLPARQDLDTRDLDPLITEELEELAAVVKEYPEGREEVAKWMAQGIVIRFRDLTRIKRGAYAQRMRTRRDAVESGLRQPVVQ